MRHYPAARRGRPGPRGLAAAVVSLGVMLPTIADADDTLWSAAARVSDARATRLVGEAGMRLGADRASDAEVSLRGAHALRPGDGDLASALADLQVALGRDAAAAATLDQSLRRIARTSPAASGLWSRLGALRARLGRYGDAAAAFSEAVASGPARAEAYANLGEMLMAEGRLGEAAARYRDAIAAASVEATGERRSRSQDLALAYFGLAVVLDRGDQPTAAREMLARALVQDPTGAVLNVALIPGGDVFFVPEGEVYYYLGLVAEAQGRATDAEAAFREFVARRPGGRWTGAAERHIQESVVRDAGVPRPSGPRASARAARVVALGTVQTSGGIGAPLVDAAWRERMGLLEGCLDGVLGEGTVRVAIELDLDATGVVSRAAVKAPPPLDGAFARCVEAAVRRDLRVAAPGRRSKPAQARTELLVAFP